MSADGKLASVAILRLEYGKRPSVGSQLFEQQHIRTPCGTALADGRQAVQMADHSGPVVGAELFWEQGPEDPGRADLEFEIAHSEIAQEAVGSRNHFGVGPWRGIAQDFDPGLGEFTAPTGVRSAVPEAWCDVEESVRTRKSSECARRDHAADGRGHFRSERILLVVAVEG